MEFLSCVDLQLRIINSQKKAYVKCEEVRVQLLADLNVNKLNVTIIKCLAGQQTPLLSS